MELQKPTKDEIDIIYEQIKYLIDDKPTSRSIIKIVTYSMKCVENTMKDKSGSYKKEVVMRVIERVVEDSKLDKESKEDLTFLIHTTIPSIIDTMVGIARHKIDIGKTKKYFRDCCFW